MDKLWIVVVVVLWWTTTLITTLSSKVLMLGSDPSAPGLRRITDALWDLRWLELTALQHLVGTLLSVIWLRFNRANLFPKGIKASGIVVAALGNVIGNAATNASFAAVSSSVTQIIKACEPVFTFVFSLLLYRNYNRLNGNILISVLIMCMGACLFVASEKSYNVWGVGAALLSNVAFPLRNIYLKKFSDSWDSAVQKYSVISFYSTVLLIPFILMKYLFRWTSIFTTKPLISFSSSIFHFSYNIASISVLGTMSPLNHSLLNLSKRIFVVIANMVYFHTTISQSLGFGTLVFSVGAVLYMFSSEKKKNGNSWHSLVLLIIILLSLTMHHSFSVTCVFNSTEDADQLCMTPPCRTWPNKDYIKYEHHIGRNSKFNEARLMTSWVYDQPFENSVVTNIKHLQELYPNTPINVFCGTTQCMNAVKIIKKSYISVEFVRIEGIVKQTPLESWLRRHTINKILTGSDFESHLQTAVELGLLWTYGGLYIDPRLELGEARFPTYSNVSWVVRSLYEDDQSDLLSLCYFPRHDPFIMLLMDLFVKVYPTLKRPSFNFQRLARKEYKHLIIDINMPEIHMIKIANNSLHYGTLMYDTRVTIAPGANLGDEMQTFPGIQFLPFLDRYLDRDNLPKARKKGHITAFFNAWWGDASTKWPPPNNINPLLLSMHIGGKFRSTFNSSKSIAYLKNKGLIGSRDFDTMAFMNDMGINSYFSGCMTLMLRNPNIHKERNNKIYLVDIMDHLKELLPKKILNHQGIVISHKKLDEVRYDRLSRFHAAYDLLEMYSQAKLVITQRIHCALPCVAMGIPVIFINSQRMPGGGGSKTQSSTRTVGIMEMFHTVDMYKINQSEAQHVLENFNWDNPPPNPNPGLVMRLQASFWNVIKKNEHLQDSAYKLGTVPFPQKIYDPKKQLVFHIIFITSRHNKIPLHQARKAWNCLHMQSLESILYHHPFSLVMIHSNTLQQSQFDVLTDVGYNVQVRRYNLTKMIKNTPAKSLDVGSTQKAEMETFGYRIETDLLKLLVLYRWGGIYLDSNAIVVRSFDNLATNIIGCKSNTTLGATVLKFKKKHPFIAERLGEFATTYNRTYQDTYKSPLFSSRIYKKWARKKQEKVNALIQNQTSVYRHNTGMFVQQCFHETSGENFIMLMESVEDKTLTDKPLSEAIKEQNLEDDSLCRHPFNEFCILCNRFS